MNTEQLKNRISEANKAYRSGTAIMSDAEYDSLLDEFKSAVNEDEYLVFANTMHETKGKIKNEFVMGSLNKLKVQEPETVKKFIADRIKTGLNVSAKVDGISCRIRYSGGKFKSANTRGDGYFGEDITNKVVYVKGVPKTIPYKDDIDVRGELVIMKDDFAEMDSDKNSRNVCAGVMNRKETSKEWNIEDLKKISFVPYTILDADHPKKEQFELLEKWGFNTAWHKSFKPGYFEENNLDVVEELSKYATQDLPYAIDGVVISDDGYCNEDKYRPDMQAAVKTNTLEAVTTLLDIEWVGPTKDGFIVPVAILDPVEIGDSMIGRATLHNLDFIDEIGLKYGCRVLVVKSGDIIPAISKVVSIPDGAGRIEYPTSCPCCGSNLARDGVNLRCVNNECRDQKIYRVMHFIKKLGVMNASFKTLSNFGVDSYDALLAFKADRKYKSQTKFMEELNDKVFSRGEADIFKALNMRGVGETLLGKIVDNYGWDAVKSSISAGSTAREYFKQPLPDGIGDVIFEKFLADYAENVKTALKFSADPRWHGASATSTAKKTVVGSVCFTGSLNTMSRGQASKLAEAAGYEVKSGVSRGLTYLVTNDSNSGSSKAKKAIALGTKIIDEKKFLEIVKPGEKVETDVMDL